MPLLLSIVAVAAISTVPECSWNNPGRDPYKGDVAAAVDAYRDIPPATRERLKERLRQQSFDDDVVITRDAISGRQAYDPEIRGMRFGATRMCTRVSRSGWSADHREAGRVVCEDGHCLLVPAVCGNLSVVHPAQPRHQAAAVEEMPMEPPSAGGGGGGGAAPLGAEPGQAVTFAQTPGAELLPGPIAVAVAEPPPVVPPPLGGIPMPIGGPPLGGPPILGPPSAVPEPPAFALLAAGLALLGLGAARRARKGRG
jgi:hypothetical protein